MILVVLISVAAAYLGTPHCHAWHSSGLSQVAMFRGLTLAGALLPTILVVQILQLVRGVCLCVRIMTFNSVIFGIDIWYAGLS